MKSTPTRFLVFIMAIIMSFSMVIPAYAKETTPSDTPAQETSATPMRAPGKKAIIVVPGIGGTCLSYTAPGEILPTVSWYVVGRLNLSACDENGKSIRNLTPETRVNGTKYGILNTYKSLCESLQKSFGNQYDVVFFPYDWRMSCATSGAELQKFIDNAGYSKVVLVAHSMGGLVSCSYLGRDTKNESKVEKLITIGTPYLGSPKSVYVMETGALLDGVKGALTSWEIKPIVNNIPAVYQLMPPSRGFGNYISENGVMKSGYSSTLAFLKTLPWAKKNNGTAKPMFAVAQAFHSSIVSKGLGVNGFKNVPTYKIVGKEQNTITSLNYTNGVFDNKPKKSNNGDGTVTLRSAKNGSLSKSNIYEFPYEHLDLVQQDKVITQVIDIIKGTAKPQAAPRYTENEKGWLVGDGIDTNRISVSCNADVDMKIVTSTGAEVIQNGDVLVDENSGEVLGNIYWFNNKNEPWKEYYLNDGEYEFSAMTSNADDNIDGNGITIEYSDAGYYEKVIPYENLPAANIQLSVQDCSEPKAECFEVKTPAHSSAAPARRIPIAPSVILDANDLIDYEG